MLRQTRDTALGAPARDRRATTVQGSRSNLHQVSQAFETVKRNVAVAAVKHPLPPTWVKRVQASAVELSAIAWTVDGCNVPRLLPFCRYESFAVWSLCAAGLAISDGP